MQFTLRQALIAGLSIAMILTVGVAVDARPVAPPQKSTTVQAAPAQAIPAFPPIVTTYDIYVGGLHLLSADILFQEQDRRYHARLHGHTYGFWYRMLPWDTSLDATGKIDNDHFVPVEFTNTNIWRHKTKSTKLAFDAHGNITPSFDPPNTDQNREGVTDDQRRGAYDPVSGLLQMLAQVAVDKNCDITVPIFDGKRRFDISGKDSGTEDIDAEDYGIYKGPARMCDATFTMVAGDWKDKDHAGNSGFWRRNDKEAGREPFRIWLAALAPTLPELPVRLQSGSVWGLIIMHLANWHYATAEELAKPN